MGENSRLLAEAGILAVTYATAQRVPAGGLAGLIELVYAALAGDESGKERSASARPERKMTPRSGVRRRRKAVRWKGRVARPGVTGEPGCPWGGTDDDIQKYLAEHARAASDVRGYARACTALAPFKVMQYVALRAVSRPA